MLFGGKFKTRFQSIFFFYFRLIEHRTIFHIHLIIIEMTGKIKKKGKRKKKLSNEKVKSCKLIFSVLIVVRDKQ